jgi:hypothetical protein
MARKRKSHYSGALNKPILPSVGLWPLLDQLTIQWLAIRGLLQEHYDIPADHPKRWGILAAHLAFDHRREIKELKKKKWDDVSHAYELVRLVDKQRARGFQVKEACDAILAAKTKKQENDVGTAAVNKRIAMLTVRSLENRYYSSKKLIKNPPPMIGARLLARYKIPANHPRRWEMLAHCLACEFVPAMQVVSRLEKRGAPKKWPLRLLSQSDLLYAREFVLRVDQERAKGFKIEVACRNVVRKARAKPKQQGNDVATAVNKMIAGGKGLEWGSVENRYYILRKLIRRAEQDPPPMPLGELARWLLQHPLDPPA